MPRVNYGFSWISIKSGSLSFQIFKYRFWILRLLESYLLLTSAPDKTTIQLQSSPKLWGPWSQIYTILTVSNSTKIQTQSSKIRQQKFRPEFFEQNYKNKSVKLFFTFSLKTGNYYSEMKFGQIELTKKS